MLFIQPNKIKVSKNHFDGRMEQLYFDNFSKKDT